LEWKFFGSATLYVSRLFFAVSAAIEWLGEKNEALKREAEEAERRKKEADEEEERKKHEGTKVRIKYL
jgi:hypothetical protein